MLNSNLVPNWTFKMLKQINEGDYATLSLIVMNGAYDNKHINIFRRMFNRKNIFFGIVVDKVDRLARKITPNYYAPKNIANIFKSVPIVNAVPLQKKYSDYFSIDTIKDIMSYELDVMIRLGFRIIKGDMLKCAKFGVWSYHHADNRKNRGGPPGFWEVMEGWPETGSVLQILSDDLDAGDVIYRSFSMTDYLLINRNRSNYYWKSLSFVPRKLRELHQIGGDEFNKRIKNENQHPVFYSNKLFKAPTNKEMFYLALRHYLKIVFKICKEFFYVNQWILLYSLKQNGSLSTSFWKFKRIIPPLDRFWADPFLVFKDNKYFIFIEEVFFKANKGHISCLTINENGSYSIPQKVLEAPYHLSYPFVFIHDNNYYMIPETKANRTIELYKCTKFPDEWVLIKTLMKDVIAVDTTLYCQDGYWWLFTNICENEGASTADELFLFYSADLLSTDWASHPMNPIVSDVKSARSAGSIFSYNGNIYRPSQNNSNWYGYGMKINHIVALSKTEYREECINDIIPKWDKKIKGMHTLNHVQGLTVIDGWLKRSRLPHCL